MRTHGSMSADAEKTRRQLYEWYCHVIDTFANYINPVHEIDELRSIARGLETLPCEAPAVRRSIVIQIHAQARLLSTMGQVGTDENRMATLVCTINLGLSVMELWRMWLDGDVTSHCAESR